ncbi:MAG TPA: polysaccharide deacetylase family protein, partial [Chthoniobacterales bacterium]|nr:polysaccharide deacetylase family protein [Chthoniobacterales bacterium]
MTGAATTSFPAFVASASAREDQLVVSVHDVAPPTRAASAKIIAELGRHGVDVCSLLVVPNYHHTGRISDDAHFIDWLRELEDAGHEIVIHGYFHERPAREDETLRERLLTRHYTSGEGEFYDLDYEEALHRITRARDEFTAAGLKPRGFIAPAWLLGPDGERAAKDAEMEYTTRLRTILDFRSGEVLRARSLVYSVRNGWRRTASLGWNAALARMQASNALVRLGLHPPDIAHPPIWRQIIDLVETLVETRT